MNRVSVVKVPIILHVRKQRLDYADDIEYIYDIQYTVIPTREALQNMVYSNEMATKLQALIKYFVQICPESFSAAKTTLTFLL